MRILLVIAPRRLRDHQKNLLAQIGFTDITEATDGAGALATILGSTPDLLLINPNLGDMDGETLAKKVRQHGLTLPIILCGTRPTKGKVVQAFRAGVTDYLLVPFTCETLRRKIADSLKKTGTVEHCAIPGLE